MSPSNTGAAITSLNIVQTGDRLEAVDNNGQIFRGTVGSVNGDQASFNIKGSTTAGNEAVIAGTFSVAGEDATMTGTWAEPALFGSVLATAKVAGIIDTSSGDGSGDGSGGTGGNAVEINGSNGNLSVGGTRNFSASGGTASYSWSLLSDTAGNLDTKTGSEVTYTRRNGGTQTITVTDSAGATDSVSFTQN